MYSIAHIVLRLDFRRTWQEAVAIVQEAASMADGLSAMPGPEDLALTDEGRLEMGFAAEHGEHPVTTLARLLVSLLEGTDPPPALAELAAGNATDPPLHDDLRGFSQALAFFERPGRQNDLMALASRLRAAGYGGLEPEQEETLAQLRKKAAGRAGAKEESDTPAREKAPLPNWLLPAGIGGAALAAIVMLLLWQGPALLRLVPGSSASGASLKVQGGAPADAQGMTAGDGTPASGPRLVEANTPPPRPRERASSRATPASLPRTPGEIESVEALPLPGEPVDPGGAAPAAGQQSVMVFAENPIYTAADPGVEPPVLVRRQLPSAAAGQQLPGGYFELIVDQNGRVEQVRLQSKTSAFHERMLVAAAKAWVFEPARRNGQPVRFQVNVPITVPRETYFRDQ